MNDGNSVRKNGEGYSDPSAYEAIRHVKSEEERLRKLLNVIFMICELSGYHIEERIVIKDKRTGKIWR